MVQRASESPLKDKRWLDARALAREFFMGKSMLLTRAAEGQSA